MVNPLVSVAIVTYNSAEYIEETLDSVANQTYSNIELVISDDCSTDKTIQICNNWIEKKQSRFKRIEIITTKKNTGVSENLNRAYNKCNGEWIKDLAGDDLLLPNCIADNIDYVTMHPDAVLVFSRQIVFGMPKEQCLEYDRKRYDYTFFDQTPVEQYERIKFGSCIPATAAFFNKSKFETLGIKCDERIPLLEDRIKWINAIRKGVHFDFFDKETVMYRISQKSLSNTDIPSPRFEESKLLAFFYYVFQIEYEYNQDEAIRNGVNYIMEMYNDYYEIHTDYFKLKRNFFVKLIIGLSNPALAFRKLFKLQSK